MVRNYSSAIWNWLYVDKRVRGAAGALMKSSVIKRSIVIDGRKTSVSLEDAFWTELKNIAQVQRMTLSELVTKIDVTRKQSNLSSAIRQFVLEHFQNENARDAHQLALSDYAVRSVE